jgi:hypothetical protein
MTADRNSQIFILTGITLLLGVLFELAWAFLRRRWGAKRGDSGNSAAVKVSFRKIFPSPIAPTIPKFPSEDLGSKLLKSPVFRRIRPVLLTLVLLLAAVPSALVVLDRWLNLPQIHYLLSDYRCKVPFLCQLPLPEYFLVVIVCLLATGVLIALFPLGEQTFLEHPVEIQLTESVVPATQLTASRVLRWVSLAGFALVATLSLIHRNFPGWELALVAGAYAAGWFLRDVSLVRIGEILRENGGWLSVCGLAHLALVVFLAVYYSAPAYLPIATLVLILTVLFLIGFRRRIPAIYWIFSLGLILFSININGWWTSVSGDEYGFYVSARTILEKTNFSEIAARLFDEQGVYGQNPYFGSIVQSIFLRIFGTQGFGWRFSNIYLIALSLLFFYVFFRTFLDRRVALLACCFLAASHYLMNFSKIGYVSLQSFFTLSLSLAAAAWAARSGRMAAYALAGLVLAMNFYAYGVALVSIPLALLLLLCYAPPISRPAILRWTVLAAGFGMLVFPLLFQPAFWKMGFGFTVFSSVANQAPSIGIAQFLINRILPSVFSYLYLTNESHFVSMSFADCVTAVFIGIGFFAILYRIRRSRFAVFFLIGWVLLLTVAGIIGSPDLPSTTRMFVVLPWWAAAAAIGLMWLWGQVHPAGRAYGKVLFGGFLAILIATNLYYANVISYHRWLDRQGFEALVLRLAEATQGQRAGNPQNYVFLTYEGWSLDPFLRFVEIYPRIWSGVQFQKVVVADPTLPESALTVLTDPQSILFVVPTLPPDWQEGYRVSLQALGDLGCPVYSSSGKWEFDMYVPKAMAWMCIAPP